MTEIYDISRWAFTILVAGTGFFLGWTIMRKLVDTISDKASGGELTEAERQVLRERANVLLNYTPPEPPAREDAPPAADLCRYCAQPREGNGRCGHCGAPR